VLTTLLLPLTTLLGTLALTWARFRLSEGSSATRRLRPWDDPGFAARQCQALIVPVGTLLIWLVVRFAWPEALPESDASGAPPGFATNANLAAAFVFALAFVSLVTERVMHVFPAPQLPEAPALRRVLLLTTVLLVVAGGIELGRGAELA